MFEQNVIRLAEGSFVIEAVDAATSLVKCGVTMQKKGILRYCPCRTFMRLVRGARSSHCSSLIPRSLPVCS
jgi:hypothetical protein